ncbi:MAG: leucine-rich repeat protein [Clostridia bacterium]|nr:leucine-rich repeat protein [Clostridia bacterium]
MKTLNLKKFLACLMATLLLLTSFSISIATAETEGDFEYEIEIEYDESFNAIESVAITGYNGTASELVIPEEIAGLPVTVIEDNAFAENTAITSVTIPETVVKIGSWAFEECENLSEIKLPSNLEEIGGAILSNTAYEQDANNWDGELLYIDNYLINSTDQAAGDVKIKDGTKIIAAFTFSYNENITSVTIPSSVKSIGIYAFSECFNLSSVTLNEGLENIDSGVFEYTAIEEITIPESVKSINSWAFSDTKIESFFVPAKVEFINDSAFAGCSLLKEIAVDSNNSKYYSADGILFEKSEYDFMGDTLVVYPSAKEGKSYTAPDNIQYLGYSAFEDLVYLKELNLPASIGYLTLSVTSNLEKVNFAEENEDFKSVDGVVLSKDGSVLLFYPNGATAEKYEVLGSVKETDFYAVAYNSFIKEITFPEGFEKIDMYTIYACENLETVNLPSTVTELGDSFIKNCPNLTAINYNGTTAQWNAFNAELSTENTKGLYVYCTDGEIEIVSADDSTEPTETAPSTVVDNTEPSETTPQESTATEPSENDNTGATLPNEEFELGDVNMDKKLNIRDATAIQKHLAKISALSEEALAFADFTQDGKVNIKDATNIQKKIAGLI